MPGTLLAIKSYAGHSFQITNNDAKSDLALKQLNKLHCNNCGTIDYRGRTVDICPHVICKQCSSKSPELLKDLKDRCAECFDAVTEGRINLLKQEDRKFLRRLEVCCTQQGCTEQGILIHMDQHMIQKHTEASQPLIVSIDLGML